MSRYTFLGDAGLFRVSRGQARSDMFGVGDSTRNIRGWKGPCYLMTDGHYSSYAELLEKTEWEPAMASSTA